MPSDISGRLVVTGHEGETAVFVDDAIRPELMLAGAAVRSRFLWGRDDIARFPDAGAQPALAHDQPPPGGLRVATLTIEPGAGADYDGFIVAALGALADADAPGFHRTPTLDFVLILQGELTLELDNGRKVLRAGDSAVLNGVRHRWSNTGKTAATLLAAQVGSHDDRVGAAAP